jgi:hybrid cluster-associated redox disulfide protein
MGKDYFVFTASTRIQDCLDLGDEVVKAFERLGLRCPGCVAAEVEDLRLAAMYHEKNLDEILRELNQLRIEKPRKKDA